MFYPDWTTYPRVSCITNISCQILSSQKKGDRIGGCSTKMYFVLRFYIQSLLLSTKKLGPNWWSGRQNWLELLRFLHTSPFRRSQHHFKHFFDRRSQHHFKHYLHCSAHLLQPAQDSVTKTGQDLRGLSTIFRDVRIIYYENIFNKVSFHPYIRISGIIVLWKLSNIVQFISIDNICAVHFYFENEFYLKSRISSHSAITWNVESHRAMLRYKSSFYTSRSQE